MWAQSDFRPIYVLQLYPTLSPYLTKLKYANRAKIFVFGIFETINVLRFQISRLLVLIVTFFCSKSQGILY